MYDLLVHKFSRERLCVTLCSRKDKEKESHEKKKTKRSHEHTALFGFISHLYASAADPAGNVFAVLRTAPQTMYFNWLDLRFPEEAMEDRWTNGIARYHMVVLKINTAPGGPEHRVQPSCLTTCTGNIEAFRSFLPSEDSLHRGGCEWHRRRGVGRKAHQQGA